MNLSEWLHMRLGLLLHPQFYRNPISAINRRLVWSIYARNKPKLRFQTEYGFQVEGSPQDIGLGSLFYRGQYEWGELKVWQNLLANHNLTILDIGANFGLYSLITAAHCRKYNLQGTKIFGFEPNPQEYKKFKNNTIINDYSEIHAYQIALSDLQGTSKMKALSDGLGVFSHLLERDDIENDIDNILDVETIDLDTWCKINNIEKIDLMKIDVEGHEFKVLKGANHLLSSKAINYLMMEVGHGHWKDALNLLRYHDYKIDLIYRDGSLLPFQESNLTGWDNIMAQPIRK